MGVSFRIRCMGLPTQGFTAFLPTPVENPAAYNAGQNKITAIMGNVPVGSPRPAALMDSTWGAAFQPSSLAPNHILPVIYVARMNKWLVTIKNRFSDVPMPVPAVAYNQTTSADNLKARIGGRYATPNPRPFTSWPTYRGRAR